VASYWYYPANLAREIPEKREVTSMSLTLKRLYVDFLRQRYQNTNHRKIKTMILDQLCRDAGFHRKHAVRILNQKAAHKRKPGRLPIYHDGVRYHVKRLWILMGQVNGRRMVKMLPVWLKHYQGPGYGPFIEEQLLRISHATIERILRPYRRQLGRRLRTGTTHARLKYRIPFKPFDRNAVVPGYLEADTVAHCGDSMSGEFLWSLTGTDRMSGWTEVRAVWNKTARDVVEAMQDIEASLPFVLKGISTDNGSEFLNKLMLQNLGPNKNRKTDIFMTRGRPYKKNDQCYVEQKNYTHVRKLLGYDRLDCPNLKSIVNDLYKNEWSLLQNFFMPQVKLVEKIRLASKYKRKYSEPMTPFERLMQSNQLTEEKKNELKAKFESLNPFELQQRIQQKLKHIWETQSNYESKRKTGPLALLSSGNTFK